MLITGDIAGRRYWSVPDFLRRHGLQCAEIPLSIALLIEMQLRTVVGGERAASELLLPSYGSDSAVQASFSPGRVVMQDASGIPVLADLVEFRRRVSIGLDAGDTLRLRIPAALIVDHAGEPWRTVDKDAAQRNLDEEYRRNGERFAFLKATMSDFPEITVFPPGSGIIHQVNLESLALPIVDCGGDLYPDSCFGTDSHTTMINALGTLGWGGGGVEALGALLGEPMVIPVPEVLAIELTGRRRPRVSATDIALELARILRGARVVGAIAEFVGDGIATLTLQERATIANMSPEYGVMMSLFPIDEVVERHWRSRNPVGAALAVDYFRQQQLWGARTLPGRYSRVIGVDLSTIRNVISGPSLPHQAIAIESFRGHASIGDLPARTSNAGVPLRDGDVVLAAITSCTNTANVELLAQAAVVARNAVARGLYPAAHVKTVFAPGSHQSVERLRAAGYLEALAAFGFAPSLYGCGPCVGNVGGLLPDVEAELAASPLDVVAVISGNRNFQGRIHDQVRSNYLASPPLVVAFAIKGDARWSPETEPLSEGPDGAPVFLRDLLPSEAETAEIQSLLNLQVDSAHGRSGLADYALTKWGELDPGRAGSGDWSTRSTFFTQPPFLAPDLAQDALVDIVGAAPLLVLGDNVTTDHISPVGAIGQSSVAAEYLRSVGVADGELGTYASRRVNHEVMVRGAFGSPRLRNLMLKGVDGPCALDVRNGDVRPVYEAARRYADAKMPIVVIAGSAYGSGSARDWAAKGTRLLGVRAVLARSFERIHRSNLAALGVLPITYEADADIEGVLADARRVDITGLDELAKALRSHEEANGHSGSAARFPLKTHPLIGVVHTGARRFSVPLALDVRTDRELAWLQAGGLLFSLLGQHCNTLTPPE